MAGIPAASQPTRAPRAAPSTSTHMRFSPGLYTHQFSHREISHREILRCNRKYCGLQGGMKKPAHAAGL